MDATDFSIDEPCRPIDPRWFSHKLNWAVVRYELGIGIHTGWIVWLNGPFPAGEYSNILIAHESLNQFLLTNKFYIADGGYRDGNQFSITPSGYNDYWDHIMLVVQSRHKTINSRFKEWRILGDRFRHNLDKHYIMFQAVANIVQLGLQSDKPAFQVHYDE